LPVAAMVAAGRTKSFKSVHFSVAQYKIGCKIAVFYSRRRAAFFDKSICGYVGKVKSHRVFFTDLSEELGHFERSFQANSYQSICD
jgi:hypothetical protein